MQLDFSKKVVVVTGSSSGLGLSIARRFSGFGATIVMNGRDSEKLDSAVMSVGEKATGFVGDVSKPQDAQKISEFVRKTFGRLDVLVCNVGSGSSVPPGEENYAEWQRVFAQNFFSATNVVETSSKLLAESQGSIICISSICGSQVISGAPVTYSAAKAALNSFVRGLARPLGKNNVRINAVEPGNLLFKGSVWEQKLWSNAPAVQDMLADNVSLARLGSPDEIASIVAFLASEEAKFITGTVVTVDGGQSVS